jgi:hypothetical protein
MCRKSYLTPSENAELRRLVRLERSVAGTLRQLESVLASRTFSRARRSARDFLGFVVCKVLLGQDDQIKEMTIAIRVFRESTEFDPLDNSKVRVAAFALRRRLATYYANEGAHDRIGIGIPIGTYVPRIESHVH